MTALRIASDADDPNNDGRPTAEIYEVSPAIAKRWLSRNVRNRKIRPAIVNAYARDMKAGHWQVTGEAVKFDTNGALSDGQHRLSAVVKSGVTVTMLVVRNVKPEAQAVMDSGVKRAATDALLLGGKKNVSILAAAARLALSEPGAGFVSEREALRSVTNAEIQDFVDAWGDELDEAADKARHFFANFDAPPSVLCLAWMRLVNINAAECAEFFVSISELRTDGTGDPRLALIRRLKSIRENKERLSQAGYLSLIFRSWNLWRAGKSARTLPTHVGNDLVKIPEPR